LSLSTGVYHLDGVFTISISAYSIPLCSHPPSRLTRIWQQNAKVYWLTENDNEFTHSNRRLLCSTRSGVTCPHSTRRRRRRAFDLPPIAHGNPAPKSRASPLTVPESPHSRVTTTAQIGGSLPPDSGTDQHPQTARPRHRSARPESQTPQLKEKVSEPARQPEYLP
jgi:hypothetical protein